MSAIFEREDGADPFLIEKKKRAKEDLESYVDIATEIIDFISNGTAMLYDVSIGEEEGNFKVYDEDKEEYRLSNGKFIYIVPLSLILGRTNEVRRREIGKGEYLYRLYHVNIVFGAWLEDKLNFKKSKRKFDWKGKDEISLDPKFIEELKGRK